MTNTDFQLKTVATVAILAYGTAKMLGPSLMTKVKRNLPDVTGKIFVITGTTSGTGFAAAQAVAEKGGEVVLLNRPSSRADAALEKLRGNVPDGKFVPISCDLQDFASVRNAAEEIKGKYDKLYCLSNNAGIMATPDKATKDGYDTQMQTNHLSHFLLTSKLFPLLVAGSKEFGDARIVNHSSMARQGPPDGLEEKYFGRNGGNLGGDEVKGMSGGPWERYGQSKLANSVFTQALHDKLQAKKKFKSIRAVAAHPGGAKTGLGTHLAGNNVVKKFFWTVVSTLFMQSAEDGSTGLLKGMMDPEAKSGKLYGPLGLAGAPISNPLKPHETDAAAKKMLWRMSEEATGKFEI